MSPALAPTLNPNPAPRMERAHAALVLVDYQQRLMPSIRDADAVVAEALFLAAVAQRLGVCIVGTEQNPAGLGPSLPAVRAACRHVLAKDHFDACEAGLLQALPALPAGAARQVVLAGCEAHVCLLQTALGLRRAGCTVFVVPSACGARRAADHALAMQRLQQAGAVLASAEMVAFEWLHSCRAGEFRAVLELVKRRAAALPGG